jgi:translation initiation factor IF-2
MTKVRISEIAKELGTKSKDVLEKAIDLGIGAKAASSAVSAEEAEKIMNYVLTGVKEGKAEEQAKVETPAKIEKAEPKKIVKEEISEEKVVTPPKAKKTEVAPDVKPIVNEKKEEITPALKVKEEITPVSEVKEEPKEESIASASVTKRRGLVIVRKRRPVVEEKKVEESFSPYAKKKNSQSLESVFSNSSEAAKKKKKIKKAPAEKKTSAEKIDIAFSDMADIRMDLVENMVVLPDFSVKAEPKVENRTKRVVDPSQLRTTKRPNFAPQGIKRGRRKRRIKKVVSDQNEEVKFVEIPEDIRVYEFAEKINKQPSDIIRELFNLGIMFTKNDFLDKDAIEILAEAFEIEVTTVNTQDDFDYVKDYEESDEKDLLERAPIITIMGHVDHGKTSLLDYIRKSKVVTGEAGGITQHVGAYMIDKDGKKITFIDTPGHEAFTQMRSRGAKVTDIVVVVVAANDGVKPQTKEAIEHARAAGVPIIIAINKVDLPSANLDMAKAGLAELDVTPTDWGGEYEFVEVSAKTGQGIDDLLEVILLQADVMELKANPNREAKATVIESSIEKGRGAVATVVVSEGTLKVGDTIVAGVAYGKVKALTDDLGKPVKEAKPGEPVVVLGLSQSPGAGESLVVVSSDKAAREYAQKRSEYLRQKELSKSTKVTLDELSTRIAEGAIKTLPVIVKADVQGSLEAIKSSLEKIGNAETKINIISSGVGGITESDVALASASENCIIFGFHIRPTGSVKEKAKNSGVEIKTYNIIYDLLDDATGLVAGMLAPIIREENIGQALVREVFSVPKLGSIAGCIVTDGKINRGVKVRLIRDGVIVYESTVSSLKRFKDDAKEVAKGFECGIGIDGFSDIKVGDYIESFKEVEEKATL